MRKAYPWKLLLLSCTFVGCTMGPTYQQPPAMDIPEEWHSENTEEIYSVDSECFVWWEALNDSLLNSLIQRAAQQNLDLFITGTRILESRAESKGPEAKRYPHVDASVSGGHLYESKDAFVHGLLNGCSSPHPYAGQRNKNFFEIGFDASWEIDLFGAAKHEINAAQARIEATEESLNDRWVTLSAEIAKNYIELRSLQQRLNVLQKNIESQQDTLHLTKELLNIGMASSIDLLQAKEQLSTLKADKPLLVLSIDKTIHRLSILLGYAPAQLFCELSEPQALPQLPCKKPLGVPSELLRRRPDIRQAERELAAATESLGTAVASLFPRISLNGFIGQIGTQFHSLTRSAGSTWFAAPQLLLPIFNSQLLKQDVDFNKIKTQEALFIYQKTVLEALGEVENALASYHHELERNDHLSETQQTNQQAYQLTLQLYQRGVKDYLEVLVMSRSLLATEDTSIRSQSDLLLHYISIYKALGGEWALAQSLAPKSCLPACSICATNTE